MRSPALFLGILIISGLVAISASLYMKSIQASVLGDNIKVEWVISEETGVQKFQVYRKLSGNQQYVYVTTINPNGTKSYTWMDNNLVSNTVTKNITYKITVDTQNQVYEFFTSVVYSPTAVQRTWGSIKAMFK